MNSPRKQIRDLLAENGLDPVQALIDLANDLARDKESYKEELDNITNEDYKREVIKGGIDIDKVRLRTLQTLNDAAQREDDQKIKLAELELKRQSEDKKQLGTGRVVNEYIIPAYDRQLQSDGKYKLIKLEQNERK